MKCKHCGLEFKQEYKRCPVCGRLQSTSILESMVIYAILFSICSGLASGIGGTFGFICMIVSTIFLFLIFGLLDEATPKANLISAFLYCSITCLDVLFFEESESTLIRLILFILMASIASVIKQYGGSYERKRKGL